MERRSLRPGAVPLLVYLVRQQFTQMLDRLGEQILLGRKVVELSTARQSRTLRDLRSSGVSVPAFDHT